LSNGAALIGARLLHEAALLVLFGAAAFPLYAAPGLMAAQPAFAAWRRRAMAIAAVLALAGAVLWLAFTTAAMSGEPGDAFDVAALRSVLSETGFGALWTVRLVGGVLLLAAVLAPAPPALQTALAGLELASLVGTGHADLPGGALGQAHRAADAVHLLAAGVWVGALWALGWMARRLPGAAETEAALRRFSGVGQVAVALLVLTGGVNAYAVLGEPTKLVSTAYGRWLDVKLAAFAGMLALAALNRFVLVPRIARGGGLARLRRQILGEQLLALVVVAVVAVVGTLDPEA
jgi:putative copper resistance protein D